VHFVELGALPRKLWLHMRARVKAKKGRHFVTRYRAVRKRAGVCAKEYVSPFDQEPGNGWDGHKDWLDYREQFARGDDSSYVWDSMLCRVSETIPHMAPRRTSDEVSRRLSLLRTLLLLRRG
jgi:hypothetical protein